MRERERERPGYPLGEGALGFCKEDREGFSEEAMTELGSEGQVERNEGAREGAARAKACGGQGRRMVHTWLRKEVSGMGRKTGGGGQGRIGLGWSGAQTYSYPETSGGLSGFDGALFIPDHQSLAFQFFL